MLTLLLLAPFGAAAQEAAVFTPPQTLVVGLEAANQAYETRIYGPHQIKVQGRLVGLLRRY